ncbi:MAG: hypothetical protein SH850_13475 [Planctomycetaceae bacterium]|nr:hypothetical protein [Planctomycetaceae bacterium]
MNATAHDLRTELRLLAGRIGPNITLDRFCREIGVAPGTVARFWGTWTQLRIAAGLPGAPVGESPFCEASARLTQPWHAKTGGGRARLCATAVSAVSSGASQHARVVTRPRVFQRRKSYNNPSPSRFRRGRSRPNGFHSLRIALDDQPFELDRFFFALERLLAASVRS